MIDRIENADISDIKELFSLQKIAFESEAEMIGSRNIPALIETYKNFEKDFSNWTVLILRRNKKIASSVRYKILESEVVEVGRLMTHPEERGNGLASILMTEVENRNSGKKLEFYTCTKSITNIQLYEHLGYVKEETVKSDSGLSFVYLRKTL